MDIIDDSIFEQQETFFLLLEVVADEPLNVAGIDNATISITDNDGKDISVVSWTFYLSREVLLVT